MKSSKQDLSEIKNDIFTTLAICALLNEEDNRAVQGCAKRLIDRAPRSVAKGTLYPMSESHLAYDIVMENVVFPEQTAIVGTARWGDYEYELTLRWRGDLVFDFREFVKMVISHFIQRGIITDRLFVTARHPFDRRDFTTSVFLPDYARYNTIDDRDAA